MIKRRRFSVTEEEGQMLVLIIDSWQHHVFEKDPALAGSPYFRWISGKALELARRMANYEWRKEY